MEQIRKHLLQHKNNSRLLITGSGITGARLIFLKKFDIIYIQDEGRKETPCRVTTDATEQKNGHLKISKKNDIISM